MITKERLEELIKEDATICNQYIDYNNNICYRYGKASIIQDNDEQHIELKLNGTNASVIMYDTKYLFETEEDARWDLEMTGTRTETLKLPTWEEFTKERDMEEFGFYSKYHKYTTLKVISEKYLAVEDIWERYYTSELSKENYTQACKLCLRLFEGEEV